MSSMDLPMESMDDDMPDLVDEMGNSEKKMPSLIEQNTKAAEEWTAPSRKRRFRPKIAKPSHEEEEDDVQIDALKPEDDILKKVSVDVDMEVEEDGPSKKKRSKGDKELRLVPVPPFRMAPLRANWVNIFTPVVKQLGLQIRFNMKRRRVEIRNPEDKEDTTSLQKAADFVRAFVLGFDVNDALALIRLDHLFLETFEVDDVKFSLKGDHKARAIGRIAGKDGRTKYVIENVTKTRIVVAGNKIHLLGSFQNIKIARHSICSLILGSQPSTVYGNLRGFAARASERM